MGVAAVPLILTAVSTGISMMGQMNQAKAESNQANYQAAVARNNAILADRASADAIKRGEIAERQKRIETAQQIGRQRASAASRGVEVDSGSAYVINEDTAGIGELDALTIRSNAEREALGFRTQSQGFTSESDLLTAQGANAKRAGRLEAVGTLIGGASSVSSKWNALK